MFKIPDEGDIVKLMVNLFFSGSSSNYFLFSVRPGSSRMPKEETVASSKLLEDKDEEIAKLKKEVNTLKVLMNFIDRTK